MISGGGLLLFVGCIMFFIGNDKSKISKGKEDCRTRAQDDLDLAGPDLVPGLQPFVLAEFTMIDANVTAKMPLQPADDLRCQGDLRQQVKHLPSLTDRCFDLPDIDLGLPAGGDAMEQTDLSLPETFFDRIICRLLCGRQLEIDLDLGREIKHPVDGPAFDTEDLLIHQSLQLFGRSARFLQQLGAGDLTGGLLQMKIRQQELQLFWRAGPVVQQLGQLLFCGILRVE